MLKEKDDMGSYYNHIIRCKPGITGLWQISGRNNITFEERIQLETFYAMRNSLKGDLKILLRTLRVVLDRKGVA